MFSLLVILGAAWVSGVSTRNCARLVPGLDRQIRGVDITNLDLMPIDPMSAEDGYRYPVLTFTCDEQKTSIIDGVTYDLPDQVFIMSEIPSGSVSTSVETVKTTSDVKETMSHNAGIGLNIGKFGFSASATYGKTQTTLSKHDKTVSMMNAYFGGRRVDLQLRSHLQLGIDAQDELARLPTTYMADPTAYEYFLRLFGTHYISSAKFGGLVVMHSETSNDYVETHTEEQVQAQAGANFLHVLSLKGASTHSTTRLDTTFTHKTQDTVQYYGGSANLLTSGGLSTWQPTIAQHPWLFSTRLSPITDLVHDNTKKAQLNTAVTDYILRSYLTVELPRLISSLPTVAQGQTRARTLTSKIDSMAHKRPLVEREVEALGQEVEREYKQIFLDYYKNDDGFHQVNNFDQQFTFECPVGKTITRIESQHDNGAEDRRWSFGCAYTPELGVLTNCAWTDYVNNYDQAFTYSCPNNGILKGWSSVHSNHNEDRRFKFKCCEVEGAATVCSPFSSYVNTYDHPLSYRVIYSTEVIKGVSSVHNNGNEDRIFRFQKCTLRYY